jgi:dihydroxy-acid dehydratase
VGQHAAGKITDADLADLEQHACPGAGSCGGMYTANTMASAIEALGLSLPNSSAQAAISREKLDDGQRAGAAVARLVADGITPRRILTRQAFENAITVVVALGGSTNAVLHLLAIASAAGVKLTLDDFTRVGKRVPVLADLRPSGKYVEEDLHKVGGTPAVKAEGQRLARSIGKGVVIG